MTIELGDEDLRIELIDDIKKHLAKQSDYVDEKTYNSLDVKTLMAILYFLQRIKPNSAKGNKKFQIKHLNYGGC